MKGIVASSSNCILAREHIYFITKIIHFHCVSVKNAHELDK